MSKFDTKTIRDGLLHFTDVAIANHLIAACDYIGALEARIAKLERVREAANLYLRTGRGDLEAALAACDDGEGQKTANLPWECAWCGMQGGQHTSTCDAGY